MTSQQSIAATSTPTQVWADHVRKAVLKFLKTAVVIDNDPREKTTTTTANPETTEDSGLGDEAFTLAPPVAPSGHDDAQNILDIRKISDSFSEQGMACAFVLPEDSDQNEDKIRKRVVCAAKTADILVIDWHLRPRSSSLTLKLLEEIAESDASENGRMRLICIYTGEPLDTHILDQAKEKLSTDGVTFENLTNKSNFHFCAKSKNSLLVLANKNSTQADILPTQLIDLFAELANGLVPAFALAAIGAVRKNTHHMLTRFGNTLDSAYIANRLITNPPGDVAELMRELLVAECDNAIGLDSVADGFLEPPAISAWLDVQNIAAFTYPNSKPDSEPISFDRQAIDGLLKNGINDHGVKISNTQKIEFPEFYRGLLSQTLAGTIEKSRVSENEFSRLVTFRREAHGSAAGLQSNEWLPSLTTGTLLKRTVDGSSKYYFCFTPACDTLRLSGSRPFVFLEGVEKSSQYNMVVMEEGVSTPLFFDKNYPKVVTFSFKPDRQTKRVRAVKKNIENEHSRYIFSPDDQKNCELSWVGEVRYGRAMSEMATLASRWMRVGVLDSEHLRLASKKISHFSEK